MTLPSSPPPGTLVNDTSRPLLQKLGWDDFQLVLAVARCAHLAKAAEVLAKSHVTLLRRLESIETRLNVRLFDRVRGRYTPTDAGQQLCEAAETMANLARSAEMHVLGQDLSASGEVTITAAGVVVSHLLPTVLPQFSAEYPDVHLEFMASRNHFSLTRREADVAIRIADQVPEWLVGRQVGRVQFRVYQQRQSATEVVATQPLANWLHLRRWIAFERDARDLKFDRWLNDTIPDTSVVLRVDGFDHALAMVRAGLGLALLPTFVEPMHQDIEPVTPTLPELTTPLWVLTHRDLCNAMRIRVLMQALAAALGRQLDSLDH